MNPELFAHYAQPFDPEVGVAVRTIDGRYFCGFKQEDGSVAFEGFIQREKPVAQKKIAEPEFDVLAPVFLYPIQMTERGLNAAIYAAVSERPIQRDFTEEQIAYCREIFVRKDKTPEAAKDLMAPGMASVEACKEGVDNGFIRMKDAFNYNLRILRQAVQKVFCPKTCGSNRKKGNTHA